MGAIKQRQMSLEEEIEELKPQVDKIKEKLAVAEAVARASMMTPPGASARLAIRKMQIEGSTEEYVPPRMVLLYLVRMGSFCSKRSSTNGDHQDDKYTIPRSISRFSLLELCQYEKLGSAVLLRRLVKPNGVPYRENQMNSPEYFNHFRILQWNMLSQTLGKYCDNFTNCPAQALNWSYRRYSVVEELLYYIPDIICLQEVDHFKFLQKVLDTQNYTGEFFAKPDSPCLYMEDNNGPDGCAIFYNRNRFECISVQTRVLRVWNVKSNQVAIALVLRHLRTRKEVCVVTTHLKARRSALLTWIRNAQARDLIMFTKVVSEGRPCIICGDFNGDPEEPFYNTVCNFQNIGLESSYSRFHKMAVGDDIINDDTPIENEYTTCTVRGNGEEVIRTIDYIFYSPEAMEVEAVAEIPDLKEIGNERLPSQAYPSDHLSLVTEFKFNRS